MTAVEFLVVLLVCLAVYRLTRLLVADEFPPVAWPREAITRRWPTSNVAYLVNCPWCTSVYVAAATVAAVDWTTTRSVPLPGLLIAAASAVAGFLATVEGE